MLAEPGEGGQGMYDLIARLFPIYRSITGDGVRRTLHILSEFLPTLKICEVPSGTEAFDWIVPDEYVIRHAYLVDPDGKRIADFDTCNLHVVGYSVPVDLELSLDELQPHLHSLPDQPDAIPYVTSYYKRNWGFCLSDRVRTNLKPGRYHAYIDSELKRGSLTYGELLIPGSEPSEVLLSTYVCHPSMANNELSGPVVTTALAQWIQSLPNRRHSYRVLFLPETIGSILYLSRHVEEMRARTIAGFVVTCVGDERAYSFLPSRLGGTLADRVAESVLRHRAPGYKAYSFLDRGSDERQYCSPGVELPVVSVMRSKYGTYPEYHTSLDDLSLVTPDGLRGSYDVIRECLEVIEANRHYKAVHCCEPQLGKRNLYPASTGKSLPGSVRSLTHVLQYCDGDHDLIALTNVTKIPPLDMMGIAETLLEAGLIH